MLETGVQIYELTTEAIDRFLAARRTQGYTARVSLTAMAPLLDHLRHIGVAPEPSSDAPAAATELERLLEEYRTYLARERGLAPRTIDRYLAVARLFLVERLAADCLNRVRLFWRDR